MKLSELEDSDQIVTREYLDSKFTVLQAQLRSEFSALELKIADRITASERATRAAIFGVYTMVVGTYALIIAALYVNHFWR